MIKMISQIILDSNDVAAFGFIHIYRELIGSSGIPPLYHPFSNGLLYHMKWMATEGKVYFLHVSTHFLIVTYKIINNFEILKLRKTDLIANIKHCVILKKIS